MEKRIEKPLDLEALAHRLKIEKGITAIVGGGGKTTLMEGLAGFLSGSGTVLVTTSTHIFPPPGMETTSDHDRIRDLLAREGICCAGRREPGTGKLIGSGIPFSELKELADYVLVEADGAKGMPLKAPGEEEPVIPCESRTVLAVAGLDGIGKVIRETCFRPERYAAAAGREEGDSVRPEDAAAVLASGDGQRKGVPVQARFAVILNKADTEQRVRQGERIRDELKEKGIREVYIARLKEEAAW